MLLLKKELLLRIHFKEYNSETKITKLMVTLIWVLDKSSLRDAKNNQAIWHVQ